MATTFRSRAVVVEAEQFTETHVPAAATKIWWHRANGAIVGPVVKDQRHDPDFNVGFAVWTRHGWAQLSVNDWVVTFPDGHWDVVLERNFEAAYEPLVRMVSGGMEQPGLLPMTRAALFERLTPAVMFQAVTARDKNSARDVILDAIFGFGSREDLQSPTPTAPPANGSAVAGMVRIPENVRVIKGLMRGLDYMAVQVPAGSIVEIQWRHANGATKFWQIHDHPEIGSRSIDRSGKDFIDELAAVDLSLCSCWLSDPAVTYGPAETRRKCAVHGDHVTTAPRFAQVSADRLRALEALLKEITDTATSDASGTLGHYCTGVLRSVAIETRS